MDCLASDFDLNQIHTIEEWFAFWESTKYQYETRELAIASCLGDDSKLIKLEMNAFLVYITRKANRSLVADLGNLRFKVRMLVVTAFDFNR